MKKKKKSKSSIAKITKRMVAGKLKETVLEEAQRITHGVRQHDYNLPENNYRQIAEITSAVLGKKFTARDCCIVMIATKLSRESYKHKRDNLVDLAGYTWCLSRIEGDEE